ncbi:ead/Ea22-like family protein [Escherichia coli]|nr:ead/Ea22-like family protein [Escherichia coli]
MSKIDYQALREIAKKATQGEWSAFISPGTGTYAVHTPGDKRCEDVIKWTGFDGQKNAENNARYIAAFNPEVVQALLDERERNQQYIKRRDQENEDIALTVGKLLIENGRLVADTLRHLADNEIDSDYFAITSTNENGTEIDHEMSITDYALQAAGTVDELVAALEAAKSKLNEQREYYEGVIADGSKRIAELESGSQAQKLVEAIIVAIENEQERLFDEDYLMDSKECIDVIREEVKRWNDSRAPGIRIKGDAGEQNDEKP